MAFVITALISQIKASQACYKSTVTSKCCSLLQYKFKPWEPQPV